MSPTYSNKWPEYAKQWDKMAIRPSRLASFTSIAKKLIANKERYLKAEKLTLVPWYMIALLHLRESDANFNTQLAQGDPLNKRSTHVPRGRGPFSTWEEGAFDALVTLKGFNKVQDWRLEKILYYSELYNGWGYHNHGVPSAYLWAGSTIYSGGKYVRDGVWSSTAQDVQPGVASVLKIMMELDPSIRPQRENSTMAEAAGPMTATAIGGVVAGSTYPHLALEIGIGVAIILIATGIVYYFYKKRKNHQ